MRALSVTKTKPVYNPEALRALCAHYARTKCARKQSRHGPQTPCAHYARTVRALCAHPCAHYARTMCAPVRALCAHYARIYARTMHALMCTLCAQALVRMLLTLLTFKWILSRMVIDVSMCTWASICKYVKCARIHICNRRI